MKGVHQSVLVATAASFLAAGSVQATSEGSNNKHVLLSFQVVDGKLVPVIRNRDYQDLVGGGRGSSDDQDAAAANSQHVVAGVFLALMFTATLVSSILIIATISSSLTMRR